MCLRPNEATEKKIVLVYFCAKNFLANENFKKLKNFVLYKALYKWYKPFTWHKYRLILSVCLKSFFWSKVASFGLGTLCCHFSSLFAKWQFCRNLCISAKWGGGGGGGIDRKCFGPWKYTYFDYPNKCSIKWTKSRKNVFSIVVSFIEVPCVCGGGSADWCLFQGKNCKCPFLKTDSLADT